ncbi:hypothetical protein N752_18105 [Desulforamulus aquiferis]|nr:hypothetical protein [Desulforamulus aquiferis]RYD03662.1 hypothetical protein N752_18105 [Desulforamulus aquiferis]
MSRVKIYIDGKETFADKGSSSLKLLGKTVAGFLPCVMTLGSNPLAHADYAWLR